MKQYNYIYKITNLINGKIYIGKHSTDDLDDGYMGSSRTLKLEFSAVGKQHFEKEVLVFSNDENELADLERHYITVLNATDPDVGYNRQINSSRSNSDKIKGRYHPMYGKCHQEETKQKISESLKGKFAGVNHPMYGRHFQQSEETKLKISESAKLAWQRRKNKESQI